MTKKKGFTLIELVVVVMILGILAAVAAPKLLSTSQTANENATKQSLSVIRDAIERFAAENGGQPPQAIGTFVADLTVTNELIRTPFPACQIGTNSGDATVAAGAAATRAVVAGGAGWVYYPTNGDFYINDATYLAW